MVGQAGQDAGPVLQDEVEGEVGEGALLHGLAGAMRSLGQGFVALQLIRAEGDQRSEAGMGGGQGPEGVVVMPVQVDVAVDEAGQDELAGRIDVVVSRRQVSLRPDGDDLLAGDGDGTLIYLGRSDNLTAYDDGIHVVGGHGAPPVWFSRRCGYSSRHSGESRNPDRCSVRTSWIPALAGMTG